MNGKKNRMTIDIMAGAPQAGSWKTLFLLEDNTFYYGS